MKEIDLGKLRDWKPPGNWLKISTLDMHTAGEPLRIITGGLPEVKGKTILEKRKYFKLNYDHLRTALMWEPRGHADMYGCIITEPEKSDSQFGVIFLHNEGYSSMCGHGIIAVTKAAVETGLAQINNDDEPVKIDTPAGQITSRSKIVNGIVESVSFQNVPSFVLMSDESIEVEGIGKVIFDVAYGGAFYAYVNSDDLNLKMQPENYDELIDKGRIIKNAVMQNFVIKHPFEEDLSFLYGTIFYGKSLSPDSDSRNVCIFAEAEVDRSPTGTGVSGRAALHYEKGVIGLNETMVVESILGTQFSVKIIDLVDYAEYKAVIPEVTGSAHFTGKSEFIINPNDPLKSGFIFR